MSYVFFFIIYSVVKFFKTRQCKEIYIDELNRADYLRTNFKGRYHGQDENYGYYDRKGADSHSNKEKESNAYEQSEYEEGNSYQSNSEQEEQSNQDQSGEQESGRWKGRDTIDYKDAFFAGCTDWEGITARYRKLCTLYHPDKQNGDVTMMQHINNACICQGV